jgi:hypothetical protein
MSFDQSFKVGHPRPQVWAMFGRVAEVAVCLPGASLNGDPTAERVEGQMRVKVGPISAEFSGAAEIERDDGSLRQDHRCRERRQEQVYDARSGHLPPIGCGRWSIDGRPSDCRIHFERYARSIRSSGYREGRRRPPHGKLREEP